MKRLLSVLGLASALAASVALPALALAAPGGTLTAPTGLVCTFNGSTYTATWNDDGQYAVKYALEFDATYTLGAPATGTQQVDVSGTLTSRTSGTATIADADVNGDTVTDTLGTVVAEVKSLNPGRGNGPQSNPQATATCLPAV